MSVCPNLSHEQVKEITILGKEMILLEGDKEYP